MIKHNGSHYELNAGESVHDELDAAIELELVLSRLTMGHARLVAGFDELLETLESER